jgi:hypothetical protein
MKLFRQLLVAPATLAMLAPIAGNASEVNLNEVSTYSDETLEITSKSFETNQVKSPLIAGGEGLTDSHNHNDGPDSFSDTTVATQTVQMLLSGASGEDSFADVESVGFSYYYGMSLDTSFDGNDNLNIVLETGNTDTTAGVNIPQVLDFGASNVDVLKVADVNYTKTFGDLTLTVGDSLDASSNYAGACSYSGFTDHLSDCGTGLSAGLGGDVSLSSSYDIGNGFVFGVGLTGAEGASSKGLFTKESADAFGAQIAYAADSYGAALSYSSIDAYNGASTIIGVNEDTNVWGLNAYYTFDGPIESLSAGYETADPDSGTDTSNWFVGVTTAEVGPGSINIGVGTAGHTADTANELLIYEASYSWDVNDGISMTLGGFMKEQESEGVSKDDFSGVALTSTFSF